jgi:hypothetical protein
MERRAGIIIVIRHTITRKCSHANCRKHGTAAFQCPKMQKLHVEDKAGGRKLRPNQICAPSGDWATGGKGNV